MLLSTPEAVENKVSKMPLFADGRLCTIPLADEKEGNCWLDGSELARTCVIKERPLCWRRVTSLR